jgi:hypothetical protein
MTRAVHLQSTGRYDVYNIVVGTSTEEISSGRPVHRLLTGANRLNTIFRSKKRRGRREGYHGF